MLDAIDAAGDEGRDGEVLVYVPPGHAILNSQRAPMPNDPEGAGAVI